MEGAERENCELAAIAAVWPELPDYIRAAIQALVRSWREGK